MKRILSVLTTLSLALTVISCGAPGHSGRKAQSVQIRVGSFNIRIPAAKDIPGGNGWDVRKARVAQAIKDNDFDVFGLQECSLEQQADLPGLTDGVYEYWFFSPYSQDGIGKNAQGIAFKKDKFTLTERHFFWPGDTPDIMTKNDSRGDKFYIRGGCCAVLTHKETGVKLFVMNTHASLNKESNIAQAPVFIKMEQRYNPGQLPSVFVGDLNTGYASASSTTYRTWWKDSYAELSPSGKVSGTFGTYNAFNLDQDLIHSNRGDYIYYRGPLEPLHYACNATLYDGHYPSDHLPIYCDFKVTNNN